MARLEHEYLLNRRIRLGIKNAEIELLFRALDRPDHIRNLLSLDLTGAWVNEAQEVPGRSSTPCRVR
jgi:hypothetical protein